MKIALLGLPGSGKTTLATLLGGMFGIMHISSGELARANGFTGSKAEKEGKLDPDETKIRRLVRDAIGNSKHYILDGFPRTIDQIKTMDIQLDVVLYLSVGNFKINKQRLLDRGRPDDTSEIIEKRMDTYFRVTYPLAPHFDEMGILREIDASGSIASTVGKAVLALSKSGIPEAETYIYNLLKGSIYGDGPNKDSKQTDQRNT